LLPAAAGSSPPLKKVQRDWRYEAKLYKLYFLLYEQQQAAIKNND
jgi:hypothetical protein